MYFRVTLLILICLPSLALGQSPPVLKVWVSEYEPSASEKKLLEVLNEDEVKFDPLLRHPDTGIIRLFPFKSRRYRPRLT